jgi:hypothetical protein
MGKIGIPELIIFLVIVAPLVLWFTRNRARR